MKSIKRLALALIILLGSFIGATAKEWRGLVPLKSTRADVERVLGVPSNESAPAYYLPGEIVYIEFAANPGCHNERFDRSWDVPSETVTLIRRTLKESMPLAALGIDPSKFEKVRRNFDVTGLFYYVNSEEGFTIVFESDPDGKGDFVTGYIYGPTAKDNYLRCPHNWEEREKRKKDCVPLAFSIDCSSKEITRRSTIECKARLDGDAPVIVNWTVSSGVSEVAKTNNTVRIALNDSSKSKITVSATVLSPNLCFDTAAAELRVVKVRNRRRRS